MSEIAKPEIFKSWDSERADFEGSLKSLFNFQGLEGEKKLIEAINYALFSGGKRFRPMLVMAGALALKKEFSSVKPWAFAIEMIHTYSLIHDDLPCMDDDDYRRGLPTVHKKFGEACALLAGDALLTEAFTYLAQQKNYQAYLSDLTSLLGSCAGYQGMIGGQANDCLMSDLSFEDFLVVHNKKTAALIRAAILGPFIIHQSPEAIKTNLQGRVSEFADQMGLLFQIKDDLLDIEQGEEDGLPSVSSRTQTEAVFIKCTEKAEGLLADLQDEINVEVFRELLNYNAHRTH